MASLVMKLSSIGMILAISFQNTVLADLQCYSCRGSSCSEYFLDDVVTCQVDNLLPTTTTESNEDFITDSDMNFDVESEAVQVVVEVPILGDLLLESQEVAEKSNGMVIDSSELPGSDRFSFRRLSQVSLSRNEESLRCVYATYIYGDTGEMSTVRSCALFDENNHLTCMNQVNGDLLTCYVCDSDMCNSSVKPTVTTIAWVLSVLLVTLRTSAYH